MQRFFVEPHQIDRDRHEIHITGNDVNHIVNVLRMKKGEELWISDKEKEYHCVIENAGEDEVLLHILYVQEPDYELKNRIYLFQGLPKADKMELIIQKAVELGAYSVVPVSTRRCVVKLDNKKAEKKVSRWQQIAESAAKQSKRMLVPEVHSVMTFKEALVYAKEIGATQEKLLRAVLISDLITIHQKTGIGNTRSAGIGHDRYRFSGI